MPSPENDDAVPAAPWALGLGLALLLFTVVAALFAQWDHWHGDDLEKVEMPTAVGDTHYAKLPAPKTGPIGLKYHGAPLVLVPEAKQEGKDDGWKLHDAHVLRADTDDSGYYTLYQREDHKTDSLFLKLGPNDYAEVAPQ